MKKEKNNLDEDLFLNLSNLFKVFGDSTRLKIMKVLEVIAKFQNNSKFAKIITKLSALNFGIYLIHFAILDFIVKKMQITTTTLNPIIMVPLLSLAVFAISALLAFILSKIPILRKVV